MKAIQARLDLAKFCEEEFINCQLQMTGCFRGVFSVADCDTLSHETENLNKVEGHRSSVVHRKDQCKDIATDLFDGGMV